ncbi:hypothetical protein IQ07DRAFT_674672 [Pyrenochaeta sp. DS3sAY3a]|nr:hypothetical protein IQ07DRAFT_674672 [Pyrenochaeta sp. DS3sAY3a]
MPDPRPAAYLRRVVGFLQLTDGLRSLYPHDKWLWIFLKPDIEFSSPHEMAKIFIPAKDEFQSQPTKTVEMLEQFGKDLGTQEITRAFLKGLTKESERHHECWLTLQTELQNCIRAAEMDFSMTADRGAEKITQDIIDCFKRRETLPDEVNEAADQIQKFATTLHNEYDGSITSVINGNDDITRKVIAIVKTTRKTYPGEVAGILKYLADTEHYWTEFESVSSNSQMYMKDLFALSKKFTENLAMFTEMIIGGPKIYDRAKALSGLRKAANDKEQKLKILFDTVKKLQSEISLKQQIITSVGYRHVLERFPSVTTLQGLFPRANLQPNVSTPLWKRTWQVIVEVELYAMLREHVNTITPHTFTALPPEPRQPEANWYLRRLLKFEFLHWTSKNKATIRNQITLISTAGPIAATARPAHAHATTLTVLFQTLNLQYSEWQTYVRGSGMFSELSESIHGYNKLFEVDETNWAKSDWLILNYLTPREDASGNIDIANQWNLRGLP